MGTHTWFFKSKDLYFKSNEISDKLDFIETCCDKNKQSEIIELESELEYIEDQNECEYHDLFRISNKKYVNTIITSRDECFDFINNNDIFYARAGFNSDNEAKEYWLSELEDFWKKYPNGLIYFG